MRSGDFGPSCAPASRIRCQGASRGHGHPQRSVGSRHRPRLGRGLRPTRASEGCRQRMIGDPGSPRRAPPGYPFAGLEGSCIRNGSRVIHNRGERVFGRDEGTPMGAAEARIDSVVEPVNVPGRVSLSYGEFGHA
jgi:hypothetical protein